MKQNSVHNREVVAEKSAYKVKLPKKKVIPERKKIRQLLHSMLPMDEEQRQLKEEQNLFR